MLVFFGLSVIKSYAYVDNKNAFAITQKLEDNMLKALVRLGLSI